MLLKLFVSVALVCVVNSSVIINVFEDGEVKASHSLRDCDRLQCYNFCRRAGFKEGTCVNNRCRCTSFASLTESKVDHSPVDSCNYRACDQLCRRLGFPGGACVGDRCKCDNFAPIGVEENGQDHSPVDSCNYQACDQLCRRLGFPGGACIGDRCKCDNFASIGVKENKADHSPAESCNYQACDQLCRRLGFPGGACVGDKCDCDNFRPIQTKGTGLHNNDVVEKADNEEDANKVISLADLLKTAVGFCDIVACDEMCHRLNFAGGSCAGGSCNCF